MVFLGSLPNTSGAKAQQSQSVDFLFYNLFCSCEVIRDQKSGESLQYAFIEFEKVSKHSTQGALCACERTQPFTPKSDNFQIFPVASQETVHHIIRRTWLFIAYSAERWITTSLIHFLFKRLGEYNLGVNGLSSVLASEYVSTYPSPGA